MVLQDHPIATTRKLSEAELLEWEEAYAAVEAYLRSLRLRNRLLIADLVRSILRSSAARHEADSSTPPRELAMQETLNLVASWTQDVLDIPLENRRLAARGRLSLLLAGMPDKWQGVFLTPAPWPEEFVAAMRNSYLTSAPRFATLNMVPQPLELNILGSQAAIWWETMERNPTLRRMALAIFILLLVAAAISVLA